MEELPVRPFKRGGRIFALGTFDGCRGGALASVEGMTDGAFVSLNRMQRRVEAAGHGAGQGGCLWLVQKGQTLVGLATLELPMPVQATRTTHMP